MKSIKFFDHDRSTLLWLSLATVTMQLILYFPALTLPFAGFEDYQFLEKGWSGFMENPNIPIQIDVGRPLGALILGMYAGIISSISDLNIIRTISVVVLSICQISLIVFLLRSGLGALASFAISTTIFTTATISSTGQWAAAAQMPVAILFAFLAAESLYRGISFQQTTADVSLRDYFKDRWTVASFISLSVSFLIYPTLALFFAVPFFGMTLFCKKNFYDARLKRMLLVATTIISIVYVFYFLIIKFIYFPIIRNIYPEIFGNPIYSFDIDVNILSRIIWMFTEVIPRFTEVFAVTKGGSFWIVVTLLLGLCAFITRIFYKEKILDDNDALRIMLVRLLFLIGFFGIANAHLILAESAHLAPRIYAAGQTMLIFVFFASIIELVTLAGKLRRGRAFVGIILFVAMVSFFFAKNNIHTTALNQWMELRYLGAEIKRQYTSEVNTIAVVQVPRRNMFIGDDIPGYNWTNSDVIGSMIPAMVAQALINIGITDRYVDGLGSNAPYEKAGRRNLKVVPIKPTDVAYIEVNSPEIGELGSVKVIDMRELLITRGSSANDARYDPREPVEVVLMYSNAKLKNDDRYGPGSAIRPDSRNADRFWETGPVPISLQFLFEDKKNVGSYAFGTGIGATGRMPMAWVVEGRGENDTWEVLDQQENQKWTDGETRTFLIKSAIKYQRYRIVFQKSSDGILRIYDIKLHYDR
jgi:hypothetical protein